MLKFIALLATPLFALGLMAAPAEADFVPATTTRAICVYGDPGAFWDLYSYRTIHYGDAHVTQCAFINWVGTSYICKQYVWNIPNPYWAGYVGDGGPATPCW